MATKTFLVTVPADGSAPLIAGNGDPVALFATVTTAVGVLVADGASPTQAHVTTLNNAYTPAVATLLTGGVMITIDTTAVTTKNQLRAALRAAISSICDGSDLLT